MSYIIENNFGKIDITLNSSITTPLALTYTVNGETQPSLNSTVADGVHSWRISLNNYSVGDVLDNVTVTVSNKHLWELSEGITILLNGSEEDIIHTNTYTHTFDKVGKYTIQAVYEGNNSLAMAMTDKKTFLVTQPSVENPNPSQTGKYKLEFVDKNLKTLTYNDGKEIKFRLTRGGTAVRGKTVEKVTPTKILSSDTNKEGIVSFSNTGYPAGSYKIGAYMYDYQDSTNKKVVDSTYKTITIKKADPTITYTTASVKKGQKVQIKFKDNKGNVVVNEKVPIYINGKLYNKKTNKNGNIWIKMTNTGTFKFKVAYKGNKNLNKKTITFTKKVKK